jgi:hypothetical protein
MKTYICRTKTGKYHLTCHPNVTNCNFSGQSRRSHNRKATNAEVLEAPKSAFCKKCFRNEDHRAGMIVDHCIDNS